MLKEEIRPTIQGLHEVLLDTIAACGDDLRGVMATADPADFADVHAEVAALAKQVSYDVIPKMRAYHEIWYGKERVAKLRTRKSRCMAQPIYPENSRSVSPSRRRTT